MLGSLLGQSCSHGEHIKCSPARAELAMNLIFRRRAGATLQSLGLARGLIAPCPDVGTVGRAFRMGGISESPSRNLAMEWDALSG